MQRTMPSKRSREITCVTDSEVSKIDLKGSGDATRELVIAHKNFMRALRRVKQIAYRKKKTEQLVSLETEVHQLREDVKELEQRRRAISAVVPPEEYAWSVAVGYFLRFKDGIQTSSSSSQFSTTKAAQSCAQLDFLRATMTPDVIFSGGRGIENMIKWWECISLWFKDVEMELDGLTKESPNSVNAATIIRVTITESTLRDVFPYLLTLGAEGASLADKLLDQRIIMSGSTQFEWDNGCGRVTRVTAQSDMLTPLLALVKKLEDVSRVFEKAMISPTFQLR